MRPIPLEHFSPTFVAAHSCANPVVAVEVGLRAVK
jgi:hypothetical protein